MFRIGNGYDVHKIVGGRDFILGGIEIPYEKGLLGHSDADVLTHAIMDAMLGALALGDIGKHFPDDDEEYKDISSIKLLNRVNELINKEGYEIVNIDSQVVLQMPKIKPYIDEIQSNLANELNIDKTQISVKATTEENLGFTGDGSGAKSYAVVLLKKK